MQATANDSHHRQSANQSYVLSSESEMEPIHMNCRVGKCLINISTEGLPCEFDEQAWHHVQMLLAKSTLPNLFDNHPPFQIDGNFGGGAGIAEMLVQSHREVGGGGGEGKQRGHVIELLPALPKEWSRGAVRGLRARGGVTIDIMWSDEQLSMATIRASGDEPLRIAWPVDAPLPEISRLSDKSAVVTTRTGNWLEIAPKGQAGEYRISQK